MSETTSETSASEFREVLNRIHWPTEEIYEDEEKLDLLTGASTDLLDSLGYDQEEIIINVHYESPEVVRTELGFAGIEFDAVA